MDIKDTFNNKDLIELALTHRSYINEHKESKENNERLEFLGDAVLEFIVSERLYKDFPEKEEGFLTALRANLVNTQNLADVAKSMGIGNIINLSKGEEDTGGRENSSLLADTFEAIVGALFLDQGIDEVRNFIHKHVLVNLAERASQPLKDFKSRLQELVQSHGYPAPKYVVINETGPDHSKEFTVQVLVDDKPRHTGKGKSKAEAEQQAAANALLAGL